MAKAMADDDGYFPKPRSSGCPERSAKGRLLNAGYGGMNIGRNSTCFFWGGDCPSEMQPATKIPPPGRRGEKSAATMRPRFRSRDLFFKLRGDQKTAAFFCHFSSGTQDSDLEICPPPSPLATVPAGVPLASVPAGVPRATVPAGVPLATVAMWRPT